MQDVARESGAGGGGQAAFERVAASARVGLARTLGVAPQDPWDLWLRALLLRPDAPAPGPGLARLLAGLSNVRAAVLAAAGRLGRGVGLGLAGLGRAGVAGLRGGGFCLRAAAALLRRAAVRAAPAGRVVAAGMAGAAGALRQRLVPWRRRVPALDWRPAGALLDGWAARPLLASRPLRVVLVVLAGAVWLLAISTPLALPAQLGLAALLLAAAWMLRRLQGSVARLALMGLALLATGRYAWWRITQSMELAPGWASVLGWGLLAAEVYAWTILLLGFVQNAWPLQRRALGLDRPPGQWPVVDVFIPTYDEPLEVLRPTVLAARDLDWPADRLRVHLLDDGRREAVRAFAAEAGVHYLTRPDNAHAKAGNLNHALACTDGEFVAVFDCDHLPVRSFLRRTMGWLLHDPRCALVQTPHHFFSPDPFERNLGTFRRVPNEGRLFYGLVQDGNDFWNAAFFCGSCAVMRREALEAVGGIAVQTVTEDAHTALKLHRAGWRSAYLNETLAAGLATESLADHVAQRVRWARGMAQIFRLDNPLLGRGLRPMQRLCYANAMLHFFYGLPRLVFLTAPLAFLLFDLHVIHAPVEVIAAYLLPHLMLPQMANAQIQGPHRQAFWAEVYESVLAWYVTLPTTLALISPRHGRFNVTAKGGRVAQTHFDWGISRPYLLLVALNLVALATALLRLIGQDGQPGTVAVNAAWAAYNLLLLGAALGVAHERRQVREAHRVEGALPVRLAWPDGGMIACRTHDYAFGGLAVRLPAETLAQLALQPGERLTVWLQEEPAADGRPGREHAFPAEVRSLRDGVLGLGFAPLGLEQQAALIRCSFTRSDAWSAWRSEVADAPQRALAGLREVARHAGAGYRAALAERLRVLLRWGRTGRAWMLRRGLRLRAGAVQPNV
ncbi:MAG: UDP-forming cellulose synthase catalytic subunit [Burkholderiaceae bacterium]|nr:UDP-forming cellulose synthase catalytic subunit [Burkholderiaceae bacterium]